MRNLAFAAALLCAFAAQATVTGNPPPASYTCNGTTTVFAIPFPYLATSQVIAQQTTAGVTTTVIGTVRPAVAPTSGTLTLPVACPSGSTLTVSRNVPLTQPQSFRTSAYSGPATEQGFDREEMQLQQLNASIQAEITARAALATKEAADVAAAINPAPVTVNSNSLILATGSTTNRTLAARAAEIVNVKDYGAVGDGITNDTAAFNAAIVAAANKTLFVPPGTYILKNVTVAVPVRIDGAGRLASTLKMPVEASLEGSPILNVTVGNVAIRHLGFDGQKASQPADGFSDSYSGGTNGTGRAYRSLVKAFAGAEIVGLIVEDCLFQNAYGAGVAASDVSHVKARKNYGNNNNFETIWISSDLGAGVYMKGNEVTGNEILNTGSGHATINGNGVLMDHVSDSIFANNIVDTVERDGLKAQYAVDTVIRGNTIRHVTVDDFPGIQVQYEGSNVIVANNVIKDAGKGIAFGYASPGTGYFNNIISGNVIDDVHSTIAADGISINAGTAASSGFTITGNSFRGVVRSCIGMYGVLAKVSIVGNNCATTGTITGSGILVNVDSAGQFGFTIGSNLINLGNVQTNAGGVYFLQSGGNTIANVVVTGNTVLTGTNHVAFADTANMITSGLFSENTSDGYATFTSTNLLVPDTNVIAPNAGWMAPSNGRVALTTPVTVNIYDTRVITNLTVAGAVTVNLPVLAANSLPGHTIMIKDGKGDAAANNITIVRAAGTSIDGLSANKIINTNYGALHLVFDGLSNWYTY